MCGRGCTIPPTCPALGCTCAPASIRSSKLFIHLIISSSLFIICTSFTVFIYVTYNIFNIIIIYSFISCYYYNTCFVNCLTWQNTGSISHHTGFCSHQRPGFGVLLPPITPKMPSQLSLPPASPPRYFNTPTLHPAAPHPPCPTLPTPTPYPAYPYPLPPTLPTPTLHPEAPHPPYPLPCLPLPPTLPTPTPYPLPCLPPPCTQQQPLTRPALPCLQRPGEAPKINRT